MKLIIEVDNQAGETTLADLVEGASIEEVEPGLYSILRHGSSYTVRVVKVRDRFETEVDGERVQVAIRDPRTFTQRGSSGAGSGSQSITATMPGKIVRVLVAVGDTVEAGQGLIVVEAMKMQNEMKAPRGGTIVAVTAALGQTVTAGEVLAVIE